ncbi:MAG: Nucleotidyl transferase [Ignavibacteria bacterium]|nr:Nucleotidyl transferase [Ignavibacteria bacterium]
MKVVILAGGYGTRISEETELKPKPMIEIGGKPILWHIMKIYSHYGFNDFIILVGYKGYLIKEYFYHYFLHESSISINLRTNDMKVLANTSEPWNVTILDTGLDTMTGGRILRAKEFVGAEPFFLTYGDGVSDININELLNFHKAHCKIATLSAVQPEGKFGSLDIGQDSSIFQFTEKPRGDGSWINGGFFVCQPEIFDYIQKGDATIFEREPLENLAGSGNLLAYKHYGFWKCMDTLRDKIVLEKLLLENQAKWKVWS